jgi:hypothetical protein
VDAQEQKQKRCSEIDAMPAGPDMDALIAEHWYGWRWLSKEELIEEGEEDYGPCLLEPQHPSPNHIYRAHWPQMVKERLARCPKSYPDGSSLSMPSWSYNIGPAMDLAFKVAEATRFYALLLNQGIAIADFDGHGQGVGRASFAEAGDDRSRAQSLAIARGALKVLIWQGKAG